MKRTKSVFIYHIFSVIFCIVLGTILHFTYKWSNNNYFVGVFSATNESTWEHLKLVFFPMLLSSFLGYKKLGENYPNFICSRTIALVASISFIIVFFYTYTGILGYNIAFFNILSFIFAIILGEYISYKLVLSHIGCKNNFCLMLLILLFICFFVFTFFPPNLNLFIPPKIN